MKKLIAVVALLSSLAAFSDYLWWDATGYYGTQDGMQAWLVKTDSHAYNYSPTTKYGPSIADDGVFGTMSTEVSSSDSSYYYYIVVGTASGDSFAAVAYSSILAYSDLSSYITGSSTMDAGTNAWKPTSYSAVVIPEPTSGLLLLVGLAGLALRRREA